MNGTCASVKHVPKQVEVYEGGEGAESPHHSPLLTAIAVSPRPKRSAEEGSGTGIGDHEGSRSLKELEVNLMALDPSEFATNTSI